MAFLIPESPQFLLPAFLACAGLIVWSGGKLTRYGDVIAEKTGLGGSWIGLVLLASITSLPELINGVSSVAAAGAPDIAAGDVMGSCVFNLTLIALMDVMSGPTPVLSRAGKGHLISAGFGIALIGVAVVSILVGDLAPSAFGIGLYSPVIVFVYLMGVRTAFLFERKKAAEAVAGKKEAGRYADIPLGTAAIKFAVNAAVIVGAASMLPFIGSGIARATGLGGSFIGTFLIGATTSLPELTVTVAAMRIGAVDMALADILGSNMFDVFILVVDDIFYTKGGLLADVAASHALTGVTAMAMTGVVVISLAYRPDRKFTRLGWDSIAIISAYAANIIILYSMRGGG